MLGQYVDIFPLPQWVDEEQVWYSHVLSHDKGSIIHHILRDVTMITITI